MVEARVGKGRVFVFGNELLFRSQPHGNFKFFFNALYSVGGAGRDDVGKRIEGSVPLTRTGQTPTADLKVCGYV